MLPTLFTRFLFCIVAGAFACPLKADIVQYTNVNSFLSGVTATPYIETFDSLAPNTILETGSSLNEITFQYDFGGVELQVIDTYDTVSGSNSLGTTDFDLLQFGDEIQMDLSTPINAFGLSLIVSADDIDFGFIQNDDIQLAVGSEFVGLDISQSQGADLPDGGRVYFLGLVSSGPYSSVNIQYDASASGFFNIDDIAYVAIPESIAIIELFTVFVLLGFCFKRKRK